MIEVQLLNPQDERYPLSFTLKLNGQSSYDDPEDSIASEEQDAVRVGPPTTEPGRESADADESSVDAQS